MDALLTVAETSQSLLREFGLVVHIVDETPEWQVQRFVCAFVTVWRRLPPWDQDLLVRHWFARGEHPRIVLTYLQDHPEEGPTLAECSQGGRSICFDPRWFDGLTDAFLQTLIAHELAHAVEWSRGGDYRNETATDALVERWGYPMAALRAKVRGARLEGIGGH